MSETEIHEEMMATRIQALYRGQRIRKSKTGARLPIASRLNAPRGSTRSGSGGSSRNAPRSSERKPSGGSNSMASGYQPAGPPLLKPCATGDASSSSSSGAPPQIDASGGLPPGSSQSFPPGTSKSLTGTSTDYSLIRAELQAHNLACSRLPKRTQWWRIEIYLLFEEPRSSLAAQILSVVLLAMIITSIVCFMIETMPELKQVSKDVWLTIEIICTVVFTIEYLTRLCVCGAVGTTMWQFVKNSMNIVDLMAILPFYLWVAMRSLSLAKALGVLRTVRLIRLFRIFKLGKYSMGLQMMAEALRNSSQALWVLGFFLCIGILLFSSAVYYVEKMDCPEYDDLQLPFTPNGTRTEWDHYVADCRVSNTGVHPEHGLCCDRYGSPLDFPSIVEAFWWSTVTMTTVGFGEVYPRTELGRCVAYGTMLSGILLIALPVAIIGRKFQEVYELHQAEELALCEAELSIELIPEDGTPDGSPSASPSLKSLSASPSLKSVSTPTSGGAPQAPKNPTLNEMSRRLRLMKLPDANMTQLAMELAEDLDEAGDMQQEIKMMQTEEKTRQAEVVDIFDGMLQRIAELLDSDGTESRKTTKTSTHWMNLAKAPKGLTKLVVSAVGASKAEAEAAREGFVEQRADPAVAAPAARSSEVINLSTQASRSSPPLPPPLHAPPSDDVREDAKPSETPPRSSEPSGAQPPGIVESPRT